MGREQLADSPVTSHPLVRPPVLLPITLLESGCTKWKLPVVDFFQTLDKKLMYFLFLLILFSSLFPNICVCFSFVPFTPLSHNQNFLLCVFFFCTSYRFFPSFLCVCFSIYFYAQTKDISQKISTLYLMPCPPVFLLSSLVFLIILLC